MIEKALFIIIVMYGASFGMLTAQYIWADVFGITMTSFSGVPIKSAILEFINTSTINSISDDIINANSTTNSTITGIERAFTVGYQVGWDIVTLLTGTYIFNFLYMMGVPALLIAGMIVLYVLLLARAITSYIRNG